MRDFQYEYDGLHRLVQADRGALNGTTFTHVDPPASYTGGQAWALDALGNWDQLVRDEDGDGADGNGSDTKEGRSHNLANELLRQDQTDPDPLVPDHTFDANGNMRQQELGRGTSGTLPVAVATARVYTHDAWNRLVAVDFTDPSNTFPRAEYEYNALNWRTVKRTDTDGDGDLNQQRVMYYNASWQLIGETIDETSPLVLADEALAVRACGHSVSLERGRSHEEVSGPA